MIQGTEEDDMDETQSIEVTVEDLVEDVSIDGMCGVY
ncbi:MAG TPA: mycofactocin precursor MftA [Rhodoglobus sp.]|nr:mycofactocin precursor MftA [Rhodoglobus sp.]